jgi:mgtE-like transporter
LPNFLNRHILRQAFIALAFDLGGLLSGRIVLIFYPFFKSAPWILALFPPMLTVRGNIGGILSGKLGTMLHIGEAEPKLRGNTREFYSFIRAILTLTFIDTVGIGILAFFVNFSFGNATVEQMLLFLTVPPLTCLLAMTIAIPIASFTGIAVFKKGLDPDVILYPMMSTVDDVLVTACYVIVVTIALVPSALTVLSVVTFVLGGVFLAMLVKHARERIFKKTLVEGGPIVLLASLLGTFGGVGLAGLRNEIEKSPSILLLYPALIDTLGDIGSILGAMETTKLALGYVASFWGALKETFADLVSVEIAAATWHILFGLVAFLIGMATGFSPDPWFLVMIALVSNLVSFLFISLFSIAVATQTFKRGLDPDNFVIPLVASVSDISATLALMATLTMLGVW